MDSEGNSTSKPHRGAALEQLPKEHNALVAELGDTEDDFLAARESVGRMIGNRN
ncbi:hypothetical protein [Nocardia salmonicida]|uniref:hypothetical protein n=1 Tax=Nocardia salmonicida TaxID=53431 RepID=UPI0033F5123F